MLDLRLGRVELRYLSSHFPGIYLTSPAAAATRAPAGDGGGAGGDGAASHTATAAATGAAVLLLGGLVGLYSGAHANLTGRKDAFWDAKTRPETQIYPP